MSKQQRFGGDHGKAPVFTPSRGDSSGSDDDTISVGELIARSLQRHYDKGADKITPEEGINLAYRTRS